MAEIVLGLGTSHSPQLSMPSEFWGLRGKQDSTRTDLWGPDGQMHSYEELREMAPPDIEKELTPERFEEKHAACQRAIAKLGDILAEVAPDVVVIVGDDQKEYFLDDNMPALSVYWGDDVRNWPRTASEKAPADVKASLWAYGEEDRNYPIKSDMALHIIHSLIDQEFEVGHNKFLTEGRRIGHAWGFVWRRIMQDHRIIPIVPVMLNTYFPPNQPTPKRCYDLGQALRRAIESWDSGTRVAVMSSGGLSHFVVWPEFDRAVLQAFADKDAEKLRSLPRNMFNSGSSETKNWITVAGATEHLDFNLVDYQPCMRSASMTGCGMAFGYWS